MSKHFPDYEYDPRGFIERSSERMIWERGLALVLEPIRERYGKWIRITSGRRSALTNAKAGGQEHSQHLGTWHGYPCCAFDFEDYRTGGIEELWPVCVAMVQAREIPCDQLINERGKIHVSYVEGAEPRYEILMQTIVVGEFTYTRIENQGDGNGEEAV